MVIEDEPARARATRHEWRDADADEASRWATRDEDSREGGDWTARESRAAGAGRDDDEHWRRGETNAAALGSRWSLTRVSLLAFLVVVAVSVAVAWWSSRPADPVAIFGVQADAGGVTDGGAPSDGQVLATGSGMPGDGASAVSDGAAPVPAGSAPDEELVDLAADPATVVVHVVGQVKHPGVVRLTRGARGADAVAAVGGLKANADATAVNLAALVSDGQQLVIPKRGKGGSSGPVVDPAGPTALDSSAGTQPADGGSASASLVNLNSASATELESLPGIGPALAERIVAWRTAQGPFTSIEQLTQVSGIGSARFGALRDLVTL
ncbi:hypothetical protein GCM10010401_19510 [Rarobacter faecitabidus]|uniref:Competence protein ComEA n=1 Tax=Rarobacter faecitabidus TaxID=13243 RepID=A0A542ZUX7_RARFA|nr:ComEA family DNA-binding protein [Rarobacter faecitabidus]TQL64157.1 competence protein ComEA [Rarobacter faecitabidus]